MDYKDIDNTWQHDWESGSEPDSDLSQTESTLSSQSAGSLSGLPSTTTWNRPGYDVRKHLRVQGYLPLKTMLYVNPGLAPNAII